jgi:hypothetical protein
MLLIALMLAGCAHDEAHLQVSADCSGPCKVEVNRDTNNSEINP